MDDFTALSNDELTAALTEARAAFTALTSTPAPTTAQVAEATALAERIEALAAEEAGRAGAPDAMAALQARFTTTPDPEPEPEQEDPGEPQATTTPDPAPDPEPAPEQPPAPQAATSRVAALAQKSSRPDVPARRTGQVAMLASADVPEFAAGHHFADLTEVAKAVINRAKGFPVPQGDGKTEDLRSFGTATFNLDFPPELTIDRRDSDEAMGEKLDYAANPANIPEHGALTAAGWCAPSETIYDLQDDSTTEGLLSLPEILVRRGGIKWPTNPTFADFYANPGFVQTEAQAIANTVKPCVTLACPPFSEARLDVEGLCIKVPILTEAAYPEVVKNFVSGTMTAHAHWINANIIGRLVTAAGAARVFTGMGGTVDDSLEALILAADQRRQKYRLSMKHPMEALIPFWCKNMYKADLRRRNGRTTPVSDAELAAEFSGAGIAPQYLYDWQALDETAEVYPATYQAVVYPAGTFVKGTAPVITLNTVYDAASLATNTYTALFTEQGFLVANRKFGADLLTLPVCNAGQRGALAIDCTP